jgi:hypothetical protein
MEGDGRWKKFHTFKTRDDTNTGRDMEQTTLLRHEKVELFPLSFSLSLPFP